MKITMAHGSGGLETEKLIRGIFVNEFGGETLRDMEDAAVVQGAPRLAVTTDSFVVDPLFFPGGDIGKLAVCGTVNDLLMRGAVPRYLTCGYVIEAGTDEDVLRRIAASMAETAAEAGVEIVAGDTKVVENVHSGGGVIINTAGVGFPGRETDIRPANIREGDVIIVSGTLGDHHAAIMSARMKIENRIVSDVTFLTEPVSILLGAGVKVRAMRDVTRGGLATILNEFTEASGRSIVINEESIPVSPEVRDFCGILGLDPLTMGNEGKFVAAVAPEEEERALKLIKDTACGREAAVIGSVTEKSDIPVVMKTKIGGERVVRSLAGEGLPRIC